MYLLAFVYFKTTMNIFGLFQMSSNLIQSFYFGMAVARRLKRV